MDRKIHTVIFDLGGVLIDWNPRYVYREIFHSEEKIDWFFENICTSDWNEHQDAGRSLQEATDELLAKHPEYQNEIKAYYGRWEEMLGGAIHDTVQLLKEVKAAGMHNLYALTNWSAETFPVALERYEFLSWFDGIVMSGEERTRKPFADIYHILLNRFNVDSSAAVFIDDSLRNIKGAEEVGITGIHFLSPAQLRKSLEKLNILPKSNDND